MHILYTLPNPCLFRVALLEVEGGVGRARPSRRKSVCPTEREVGSSVAIGSALCMLKDQERGKKERRGKSCRKNDFCSRKPT